MQIELNGIERAIIVMALQDIIYEISDRLCPEFKVKFPERYSVCEKNLEQAVKLSDRFLALK